MGKFLDGGGSSPQPSSRENPEDVGYAGRTLTFQTTGSLEFGIYSRNINARERDREKKTKCKLGEKFILADEKFLGFPHSFFFWVGWGIFWAPPITCLNKNQAQNSCRCRCSIEFSPEGGKLARYF